MKLIKLWILIFILLFSTTLKAGDAYSKDMLLYKKAKSQDTIKSYQNYLDVCDLCYNERSAKYRIKKLKK